MLVPLATMGRMLMVIVSQILLPETSCASWDATAEPVTKTVRFASHWCQPVVRLLAVLQPERQIHLFVNQRV